MDLSLDRFRIDHTSLVGWLRGRSTLFEQATDREAAGYLGRVPKLTEKNSPQTHASQDLRVERLLPAQVIAKVGPVWSATCASTHVESTRHKCQTTYYPNG